jgi:AcrR family transcriptional regulator
MSNRTSTDKYSRRRLEILMAAASVIAEKGFHGCRTQDIADRLNLKQASLYYYFPTKESALEAVCLYAVEESTNRLRQITQSTGAPLADQIHAVIHAYLHDMDTHRDCMIVLAEQRRYLGQDQQVAVRAQRREYRALLEQMLEDARANGQLSAGIDCQLAVRALIDLCHCAALRLQRNPGHDATYIIDQYSRLFCKGIEC